MHLKLLPRGPNRSVHSGMYEAVSPNPNERVARLLTELKDVDHRINIGGFYDDVLPPTDLERKALHGIQYTDEENLSDLAYPAFQAIPGAQH